MPTVLVDRTLGTLLYCIVAGCSPLPQGGCHYYAAIECIQTVPPQQTTPQKKRDERPKGSIQQEARLAPARYNPSDTILREILTNVSPTWNEAYRRTVGRRDSEQTFQTESVTYFRLTESARASATPSSAARYLIGAARTTRKPQTGTRYPDSLSATGTTSISPLRLPCSGQRLTQVPWQWRTLQEKRNVAANLYRNTEITCQNR